MAWTSCRTPDARGEVIAKVKTAFRVDNYQLPLPTLDDLAAESLPATDGRRRLGDFQRFHRALDQEKGFIADLFLDYICLTEEVGEIGRELKHAWARRERMRTQVGNREEANDRALETVKDNLQEELADALAFLLKMANDMGIDLETAYLKKMGKNWTALVGTIAGPKRTLLNPYRSRLHEEAGIHMVTSKHFIAIAGNIGAGKSTLTGLLSQRMGWQPFYEAVSDNPYLADFYEDMPRYAFHSQIFFLSRRLRHHRRLLDFPGSVVQDRSVYEDAEIFARGALPTRAHR